MYFCDFQHYSIELISGKYSLSVNVGRDTERPVIGHDMLELPVQFHLTRVVIELETE